MAISVWLLRQSLLCSFLFLGSNAVVAPAPTAMYMLSKQYKAEDLTCNGNAGQSTGDAYRKDPSGKPFGARTFGEMVLNKHVTVRNSGQLDFQCKFTILANLYAVDTCCTSGVIVSWGSSNKGTVLYHTADARIRLQVKERGSSKVQKFYSRGYDMSPDGWYYIAASYDCGTKAVNLFVKNGRNGGTYSMGQTISGDIDTTGDVNIGGIPNDKYKSLPGSLHCVRLFDSVLTQDQINAAENCNTGSVNNGKCSASKCKNSAICQDLAHGFQCNNCPASHYGFCCST